MGDMLEHIEVKMSDSVYWCVRSLEREIGYVGWGTSAAQSDEVLAEWTRQLARVVERHTAPPLSAYGEDVMRWARQIYLCETGPASVLAQCEDVHRKILDRDNNDGWPTDRDGSALNAVCLGAMFGIDGERAIQSRWPAEAAKKVWRWATGAGAGNDVVAVSRAAWLRHLYGQTLAVAESRTPAPAESKGKG